MDNSGSSTSQWFNVQVEEEFYKNVNVFTVQKSTKKLVDLSVKSKKPIPSPRFVHENKSLELDSKLSFQNTGAVKKLSNQLSNESNSSIQSQNSSDNPQSPKSPKTPEENDEVTLKRSSSIYKSFKKLFVSKRHRKHRKNQPSSPITPGSATPEDLADYDVQLRRTPMVDPSNHNDTIKESNLEDQRRFQEICKRISGRISTRLEGATAPTFEDEEDKLFYANIDMAMKAHLSKLV